MDFLALCYWAPCCRPRSLRRNTTSRRSPCSTCCTRRRRRCRSSTRAARKSCCCRGCNIRRCRASPSRTCGSPACASSRAITAARHAGRLRHPPVRDRLHARRRRQWRATKIALPAGACPGPGSLVRRRQAFRVPEHAADAVELWIGDAATGAIHRLGTLRLNPMLGSTLQWMADQKTLLVKLVPDDLGAPPAATVVPAGPDIQEAIGGQGREQHLRDARHAGQQARRGPVRLLRHDRSSRSSTSPAARSSASASPALYTNVDAAPDGEHVLDRIARRSRTRTSRPTSASRTTSTCWDLAHDTPHASRRCRSPIACRCTACRPARATSSGAPTEPATLVWAEALDGGDWNVKVPARDKVMMQSAPFTARADGDRAHRAALRRLSLERAARRRVPARVRREPALARTFDRQRRRSASRSHACCGTCRATSTTRIPARSVYRALPNGAWVVRQDGDAILPARRRARRPTGDRPFLDRLDLKTQQVRAPVPQRQGRPTSGSSRSATTDRRSS